jgi:hypothetical protein
LEPLAIRTPTKHERSLSVWEIASRLNASIDLIHPDPD